MIDAHLHFWAGDQAVHAWPDDVADALRRGFTPDDLRPQLSVAGVRAVVLMQSRNDFAESVRFASIASENDFIGALVGWADLTSPEHLDTALDELAACGKLRGIRHLINFEADPNWLRAGPVRAAIGRLAERELVLDTVPNDIGRFEAVIATAKDHPRLTIVIDHLGRPPLGAPLGAWGGLISRAADLPNVSIKLSVGLDLLRGWRWSTDSLRPYAQHIIACFGPKRVMAASNWPVVTASASYGQAWKGLADLVAHLPAGDRADILGRNTARIFGFPAPFEQERPDVSV